MTSKSKHRISQPNVNSELGGWSLRTLPAAGEGKCSQLEAQRCLFERPCFTPVSLLTLFTLSSSRDQLLFFPTNGDLRIGILSQQQMQITL